MKVFKTDHRQPTAADGNLKGFVFARKPGRIGWDAVQWSEVNRVEYPEWSPIEAKSESEDGNV
jgi:hypothetical protein